jgi:peptidoglycan/LPS O-acetylase OafA/YrhL
LSLGIGLSTLLMFYLTEVVQHNRIAQIIYPFAAAAFGSFAILSALALDSLTRKFPGTAMIAGALSYPIYLFHLLILSSMFSRCGLAAVGQIHPVHHRNSFDFRGQRLLPGATHFG